METKKQSKAARLVERYKKGKIRREANYWQLNVKNQLNQIINNLSKEESDENALKIIDKLNKLVDELDLLYLKVTGTDEQIEKAKENQQEE